MRVLVVDDSEDVRLVLRLRAEGWPIEIVGEAKDGRDALRLVEETSPDVIVLDHEMPELTGMEVIPHLRKLSPTTPIVMFIGYEGNGPEAVARGADAWVSKLAPWDDLFELVVAYGAASDQAV